ncbi:MAG: GH32 C-terminal domain-containing protein, partial [Muribaculaceae bacterium]|nr:GH32 C-terminal domain-containing protein [Muribaculaceae bacterium]
DFTQLLRLVNDAGIYDGIYSCTLPERPAAGKDLKINLFIDHSIIDIFVNDRWATSIRVFPTDADADGIEAFAESEITVKELKAWILNHESSTSGIESIIGNDNADSDGPVDIYNLSGVKIRTSVSRENATEGLPAGFYIVGNRKVFVR